MANKSNFHFSYHLTTLANDRTILAYVRTALALLAGGVSFYEFFETSLIRLLGVLLVFISFTILLFGVIRFIKMRAHIKRLTGKTASEDLI
jgi:putative membrane protein